MKGIVLAGGLGTRLSPLTQNDNKHLLPVFDKRMVELPLKTLVDVGIKDIVLITGGKKPGSFLEIFKNGKSIGANRLFYTYQEGQGGIADALKLAKPFVGQREPCVVILGDNYFEDGIKEQYKAWDRTGASMLIKHVDKPWDFGIAEIDGGLVTSIEEKPKSPKSNYAITGCYMFDYSVWSKLDSVEPSDRGELEVTDLLKFYLEEEKLKYSFYNGYWKDMGSFESWMEVSKRVANESISNG